MTSVEKLYGKKSNQLFCELLYDFKRNVFNLFLNKFGDGVSLISLLREFQNFGPSYINVFLANEVLKRGK